MEDGDRLFIKGAANPARYGWSIRSSAGDAPDSERISEAARHLGRPAFFVDGEGCECEIIGAATSDTGDIAYVESRANDGEFNPLEANQSHVDISIRVCLVEKSGQSRTADIESYNPFFGCDVRFIEWLDCTAVLIYREKHWTFACRFGDVWPPRFVRIEDDWVINGHVLAYVAYKEEVVRRMSLPALHELAPISAAEASQIGMGPAT